MEYDPRDCMPLEPSEIERLEYQVWHLELKIRDIMIIVRDCIEISEQTQNAFLTNKLKTI